jgi:UTP--glucose-1-phosphate uridylyltransferase
MPCFKVTLRASPGVTERQPGPIQISRPVLQPSIAAEAPAAVRKAVIPAAGLGMRLFPATKVAKKELFPIVDRDGIAKPAILLIVEEALQAGIEEVIVIVQPQDLASFDLLFDRQPVEQSPAANDGRLPAHLQAYARRIAEMGRHVSFVTQPTQEGFGHAVYRARQAVGDEPFLLMLGDHLYRSKNTSSCARQLLDAYARHRVSVLGLRQVPERDIVHYGIATGRWLDEDRLLQVACFVEKPTVDEARAHLHVSGLPEGEYLAFFGQYLLKPRLFDYLEEQIASGARERGEFQLTSALEQLRQEDGFLGLVVDGQCYDIGLPDSYLQTLQSLRTG